MRWITIENGTPILNIITHDGTYIRISLAEENVTEVLEKVKREFELKGLPASVCYPTYEEIMRGELNAEDYASSYCYDVAYGIMREVRRILGLDPF